MDLCLDPVVVPWLVLQIIRIFAQLNQEWLGNQVLGKCLLQSLAVLRVNVLVGITVQFGSQSKDLLLGALLVWQTLNGL